MEAVFNLIKEFVGACFVLTMILVYNFFRLLAVILKKLSLVKSGEVQKYPVVFIHGYLCNSLVFLVMRFYFYLKGYRELYFFNYNSLQSIEVSALDLKAFLEKNRNFGVSKLDLVCHSEGGHVALNYVLNHKNNVGKLLAFGTPFKGAFICKFIPGKSGRDMEVASEYVKQLGTKLNEKEFEGIDIHSIYSNGDYIIPPENAELPQKKGIANHFFRNIPHHYYLLKPSFSMELIRILKG